MIEILQNSNNISKNMQFIKVNPNDESHKKYLYDFLAKRKFNISHTNMPTYKNHCKFVKNNPYRKWFLISNESSLLGSVYILYDNGIGIDLQPINYFLIQEILIKLKSEVKPLKSIPSIRNNKFHINISHLNRKLYDVLTKAGGIHIQDTFLFDNI
tara:strand:+ start:5089 stop:5556 length:468 start_codon:yes stop_codon:yes gene_type:complete